MFSPFTAYYKKTETPVIKGLKENHKVLRDLLEEMILLEDASVLKIENAILTHKLHYQKKSTKKIQCSFFNIFSNLLDCQHMSAFDVEAFIWMYLQLKIVQVSPNLEQYEEQYQAGILKQAQPAELSPTEKHEEKCEDMSDQKLNERDNIKQEQLLSSPKEHSQTKINEGKSEGMYDQTL